MYFVFILLSRPSKQYIPLKIIFLFVLKILNILNIQNGDTHAQR